MGSCYKNWRKRFLGLRNRLQIQAQGTFAELMGLGHEIEFKYFDKMETSWV